METSLGKTQSVWFLMIPPAAVQFLESNRRQASVFHQLPQEAHGRLELKEEKM